VVAPIWRRCGGSQISISGPSERHDPRFRTQGSVRVRARSMPPISRSLAAPSSATGSGEGVDIVVVGRRDQRFPRAGRSERHSRVSRRRSSLRDAAAQRHSNGRALAHRPRQGQ
jgi:hypothetical protein